VGFCSPQRPLRQHTSYLPASHRAAAHEGQPVCQRDVVNTILKNGTSADRQLATYRKAIADGDSEREALIKVTDRKDFESPITAKLTVNLIGCILRGSSPYAQEAMMRTILTLLLVIVIIALASTPRHSEAQADKPKCDIAAVIAKAAALKTTGDAKKDLVALNALSAEISAQNAICNGYIFTGKGEKVLTPFILPKGLWKVIGKSNGYLMLKARSMEGSDCKAGAEDLVLNLDTEQAKEGGETVLDIEATCRLLLSISNTSTTWTITFEPIE
jgi:hypothetical protein